MSTAGLAVLIVGAFAAGWVDALIGGGGLILIPLIMACCPQAAPVVALATNKTVAFTGTTSAAFTLSRRVGLDRRLAAAGIPIAVACSIGGALAASHLSADILRPVVIVLMLAAGLFVALRPSFGTEGVGRERGRAWGLALIAPIALYDGLLGPGTGMFLLIGFTALFGQSFLHSSALAKVINAATNCGALITFILAGHIWWSLAIPLALANLAGAQVGARTVLKGGSTLLRVALLVVVIVMASYLTYVQVTS